MFPYEITVITHSLEKELRYKEQVVLRYTIRYPSFHSNVFQKFLRELNSYYKMRALLYEKNNIMKLYQMAVEEYEYSVAQGFPVRVYEAYTDFKVTYNQNCVLSLYFDEYEYTGGAHGNTTRYSDTWDLKREKELRLADFISVPGDYREYIVNEVKEQIKREMDKGNDIYFEDYAKLAEENFNVNNFYLIKEGIVVYFQQYDIAPYSSGIREFLLPFSSVVKEPEC